jgi:hypothetical protein
MKKLDEDLPMPRRGERGLTEAHPFKQRNIRSGGYAIGRSKM